MMAHVEDAGGNGKSVIFPLLEEKGRHQQHQEFLDKLLNSQQRAICLSLSDLALLLARMAEASMSLTQWPILLQHGVVMVVKSEYLRRSYDR